jgi:hypothetical protein
MIRIKRRLWLHVLNIQGNANKKQNYNEPLHISAPPIIPNRALTNPLYANQASISATSSVTKYIPDSLHFSYRPFFYSLNSTQPCRHIKIFIEHTLTTIIEETPNELNSENRPLRTHTYLQPWKPPGPTLEKQTEPSFPTPIPFQIILPFSSLHFTSAPLYHQLNQNPQRNCQPSVTSRSPPSQP